jgi:DNA-binding CsgD family transcriptional regulator
MARAPAANPIDALTPREREVARLMARGLTNPQIAEELGIGFGTAKTHVSQVIAKLGVSTREEATAAWRSEQRFGRRMHRGMAGLLGLAGWKTIAVAGAGVAALAVAVPIAAILMTASGDDDGSPGVSSPMVFSGQWERLPEPPIRPRANVVSVWTGQEALFVGGDTFVCSPGANCVAPPEPPFQDGAVYDPVTNAWRRIADAPVPIRWASTAVLDGQVYFLAYPFNTAETAFLRYDIGEDEWTELDRPPGQPGFHYIVATDTAIIAYATTHERGEIRDYRFDTTFEEWTALPPDPLAPSFDRSMVWAGGQLYLFARELPGVPGSSHAPNLPSVVQAARYDFRSETWQRLSDSEILSSGPWYLEDGLIVNPALGGADGGEVNNWGRTYLYGGMFETRTGAWRPLPQVPDDPRHYWTGVLGSEGAMFIGLIGHYLDLVTNTWAELPELDPFGFPGRRNVMAAGTDIIVFGGERWDTGSFLDPEAILGDVWIWRSGR